MSRLVLKSSEFRLTRQGGWRELEHLVDQAEKNGIRSLSAGQLQRLPVLYRATLSSLSVARTIALDRNLLLYLENLVMRGFITVYGSRINPLLGMFGFLRHGFPGAVRAARWHFLLALACTLVGLAAGFMLVHNQESWFTTLVPSGLGEDRGPASTRATLLSGEIFAPWPGIAQAFVVLANFLFTHNTLVGILTFSLGIAAGVPTVLLLIEQGLILGAFVALHANRGLTLDFLGWVSIHGVTEITAILLCGTGGLIIAEKMLFPGRRTRMESLATAGHQAARIAIGAMLMFFVAAILEGGFRQLVASTEWRFAIGGVTGILWLAYFTLAGRRSSW